MGRAGLPSSDPPLPSEAVGLGLGSHPAGLVSVPETTWGAAGGGCVPRLPPSLPLAASGRRKGLTARQRLPGKAAARLVAWQEGGGGGSGGGEQSTVGAGLQGQLKKAGGGGWSGFWG